MKKLFTLMLVMLTTVALLVACGDDEEKNEDAKQEMPFPEFDKSELNEIETVAEYEGGTVSGNELAQFLAIEGFMNPFAPLDDQGYRNEGLQNLVMIKVIGEKVEDKSWAEEQSDILWEQVLNTYDEETRERGYEKLGITEEEVKDYVVNFYLVQDYFRSEITDEDIQKFYDDNKGVLTTSTFSHILIKTTDKDDEGKPVEVRTEEEAVNLITEIEEKLEAGESFEELAKEYSEDPGSKENGGKIENAPVSQLDSNFGNAVLAQEIGEVGKAVKSQFGYHLIKVESRDVTPLEEVKEAIMQQIAFGKSNEYLALKVPALISSVHDILKVEEKADEGTDEEATEDETTEDTDEK